MEPAGFQYRRMEGIGWGARFRMSEDPVLTIKDVASILKLAEKTVYSMAQGGELPAFKIRGQWRIRRVDFDAWIAGQASAEQNNRQA
jgi:excisionase family DNA binding protein